MVPLGIIFLVGRRVTDKPSLKLNTRDGSFNLYRFFFSSKKLNSTSIPVTLGTKKDGEGKQQQQHLYYTILQFDFLNRLS